MEEERVDTIDIFLSFLLMLVHRSGRVADYSSELIPDRNHQPVVEESVFVALFRNADKS